MNLPLATRRIPLEKTNLGSYYLVEKGAGKYGNEQNQKYDEVLSALFEKVTPGDPQLLARVMNSVPSNHGWARSKNQNLS